MDFYNNLEEIMKNYTTTGAFLTVSDDENVNTMTVSWGFVGFLWGKPSFVVGVRPQRFTKTILDNAHDFTISVPFKKLLKELNICGTKSGYDFDKSTVVEYTKSKIVTSPVIEGCDAYFECKIKYVSQFDKDCLNKKIMDEIYPNNDLHYLYLGEIVASY